MSAPFVEFRDPQPSFVRPIDASTRLGSNSWVYSTDVTSPTRSYGPRTSHASSHPRSPYSYTSRVPPPRPLDIPDPAPTARGVAEPTDGDYDLDPDPENLDLDANEFVGVDGAELDAQYVGGQSPRPRRRFVGGFVANLRKLPRAVARNFVHDRRPSNTTIEQYPYLAQHDGMPHVSPKRTGEAAPPYKSPGVPIDRNARYVQAMDMPQPQLAAPSPPPLRPPGPAHSPSRSRDYSHHSSQSLSASVKSSSGRRSRASMPPTVRNPDPDTSLSSSEGSLTETNHQETNVFPVPAPQVPQDGQHDQDHQYDIATPSRDAGPAQPTHPPAVHIDSSSPVYHEPPLAEDYGRMESPVRAPEEPPLPKQFARVGRFFQTINDLPWFASTIAADFVPEESARARRKHTHNASWYTSKHRDVDLLGGGSSTRMLLGRGGHAPHASSGTLPAYGAHASRASVDNLRAQQPMAPVYPGQHPYAIAPLPPPQPMYFYPSPAAQAAGVPPETRPMPAYPLYLYAISSPSYLGTPELGPQPTPPPIRIHAPQNTAGAEA